MLHIEDSEEMRNLYLDMFKNDNHSITSVGHGKEGLELLMKNDYDLILLDMIMPDYNGIEFLYDLKKSRPAEIRKVVVVSGMKFQAEQIRELMDLGIHSIEGKPHNLRTIIDMQKNMVFK